MNFLRKYGKPPYRVALIHGGPGAAGEMAAPARELSSFRGILEPLQTKTTIEGQLEELKAILERNDALPVILIGYSWGAWLSFLLSARYPSLVKKLILVSSGPFEESYAAGIMETRISRLSAPEREDAMSLVSALQGRSLSGRKDLMMRFGELNAKADSYDPLPHENEIIDCQPEVFQGVWEEAAALRASGRLLELGKRISCPVTAVHGDHDPHPADGVRIPLSRVLKEFKFVLIEKCGHRPWRERAARDRFYDILKNEL